MRKIFSIFLCAMILVSTFCSFGIFVSAEEATVNSNNLKGIWLFNETINSPTSDLTYQGEYRFPNNSAWNGNQKLVAKSTGEFQMVTAYATVNLYNVSGNNLGWTLNFDLIYFGKSDTSSAFFRWVQANATKIADEIPTHCDGSMCSSTPDANEDNICDTCKLPFVMRLRNDVYEYNGYSFAYNLETVGDVTNNVNDLWETIDVSEGDMIILASSDDFESAILYTFSSPVKVTTDNKVYTSATTVVSLYKGVYADDGTPYWKLNGRESWGADAYISTLSQIHWSADDLTNINNTVVFNGDENFMKPLWEKVEVITQGAIPHFQTETYQTLVIMTISAIGCLILLILLFLLLRTSSISLKR